MTYIKVKGACISLTARKKGPVYHLQQVKGACISQQGKGGLYHLQQGKRSLYIIVKMGL